MEVLSTLKVQDKELEYRFRYRAPKFPFSKYMKSVLQVGVWCQDWDTNSGHDVGPQYIHWRDANFIQKKQYMKTMQLLIDKENTKKGGVMSNKEMIEFAVEKIHETELGLIVYDGDKEISLPKSQIKITEGPGFGDIMLIEVPKWLAEKEEMI